MKYQETWIKVFKIKFFGKRYIYVHCFQFCNQKD